MTSLRSRAALALLGLLSTLLASTGPAAAVSDPWNDGRSDHDTITDCITGTPGTGLHAQVGWRSTTGRVPEVGERFWIRAYVGLVALPCTQRGASFLPEVLLPAGVEYADDATHQPEWALGYAGQPQDFRTDGLAYDRGRNGGLLIGLAGDELVYLRQSQVFEVRIPVVARRELKGPATPQPECRSRREGTAPCPVAQAGDHLQVGFTLGGYGSDKSYVTPYVGLFATAPTPTTPTTPTPPRGKAASHTTARWAKRVVEVRVTSRTRPTGAVTVLDRGRRVARATLRSGGRATVQLPRLARGRHVLTVRYAGSARVAASTSRPRTFVVR